MLFCGVACAPAQGQSALGDQFRALANTAIGKKFNSADNLDMVTRMRNGAMPPQPDDGGCRSPEAPRAINAFLQQRRRTAELAEYSRLVYAREGLHVALKKSRLSPAQRQFQDVNYDPATALAYLIVAQAGADDKLNIALVFEGSTFKHGRADALNKFIAADVAQLLSKATPKMFEGAEAVYLKVLAQYPPSRAIITLSGHSLGGALAAYVGAKYQVRTVTFNPARLSKATIDDAARKRPDLLEPGMYGVRNIMNVSSATDTVHFMGIPGQTSYLPGDSFVVHVGLDDPTGHGMDALSEALTLLAQRPPTAAQMCEFYYGNDATWSALNSRLPAAH